MATYAITLNERAACGKAAISYCSPSMSHTSMVAALSAFFKRLFLCLFA